MKTLDELFGEEEAEGIARSQREQTPGTGEHIRAEALAAESAKREAAQDAVRLARALAAGLVVGVTCDEKGVPLDLSDESEDEDSEDAENENENSE